MSVEKREIYCKVVLTSEFNSKIPDGKEITIKATLDESPMFNYGNHSCVVLDFPKTEGGEVFLDTRYEKGITTEKGFEDYVLSYLRHYYGRNLKEITKI